MLKRFPLLLLFVLLAAPAGALLTDDEPANDTIATATTQIAYSSGLSTDAGGEGNGEFTLVPNDVDYLKITGLSSGDIIVATTTPLENAAFDVPDTIIGIFDAGGSMECLGDDAYNNDLDPFAIGFGSLCRWEVQSAGDYFVGVTGFSVDPFVLGHSSMGDYTVTVTVIPEPALILELACGGLGLAWLQRRRNRKPKAVSD